MFTLLSPLLAHLMFPLRHQAELPVPSLSCKASPQELVSPWVRPFRSPKSHLLPHGVANRHCDVADRHCAPPSGRCSIRHLPTRYYLIGIILASPLWGKRGGPCCLHQPHRAAPLGGLSTDTTSTHAISHTLAVFPRPLVTAQAHRMYDSSTVRACFHVAGCSMYKEPYKPGTPCPLNQSFLPHPISRLSVTSASFSPIAAGNARSPQ